MLPSGISRPFKIIVVGSSGVGKTSLINSYFDQPYNGDITPTVAPVFLSARAKLNTDCFVDLHIWDTAGQERFLAIGGLFYRDSDAAFVCFDASNAESAPDWVERVRRETTECKIFLVGTKADLLDDARTSEFTEEGKGKARQIGAVQFYLTSSAKGSGIKELFAAATQCAERIRERAEPLTVMGEREPEEPEEPRKECGC
jgi:small GTP-binding protein